MRPSSMRPGESWMRNERGRLKSEAQAAYIPPPLRDLILDAVDRRRSSYRACLHPDTPEGAVDSLPLLPLGSELRPAFSRDPVVLALAAALGRGPLRRDMTLALEPVQHRDTACRRSTVSCPPDNSATRLMMA